MTRALLVVSAILVGLLAHERITRAGDAPAPPPASQVVAPAPPAPVSRLSSNAVTIVPSGGTPSMDFLARLEGRRRLSRAGRTTYFDSLFSETDSVVRRWPDIKGLIFTVAVPPDTTGRDAPLLDIVTRALRAWEAAGLGIRFSVRTDSAGADIVAFSAQTLGENRAGQTDVRWSSGGTIHSAVITLARRDQQNRVIPPEILHAIAVHEVGHALGMSHSPDAADVMYPSTRTGSLSARDLATFRLLYQLPLGTIRETPP